MLPSQKNKMAAYYVKNKKYCRRHLGLSRHFDFLFCNIYFIAFFSIRTTIYQKIKTFHSAVMLQ
jgi:hypothetical protein